jgi:alkanesulfonate monooxygenase SsuD/methylene tetrahydromethanopterin reductase-like flavin-dependent oxidoreductase (luciferase family)
MAAMRSPGHRPEIGLNLPTWSRADGTVASWAEMRALARDAEALGVGRLWVPDHLVRVLPTGRVVGFRECWTILTATAEATSRIGIGSFMASAGFRNAGLLARMAETLDEVSGGRLVLGIGSGVPATDSSWRMFGYDDARPVQRFAETLEAITRLLHGERVTLDGEAVHLVEATLEPRGPRPGGLPVWAAAKGERTMDVAARWADGVNVNVALAGPADAASVTALAGSACERVGRDPATLSVTGWGRISLDGRSRGAERPGWLAGEPAEVAATLRAIGDAGVRHVSVYVGTDEDTSPLPALTAKALERFAPVLEAVAAS